MELFRDDPSAGADRDRGLCERELCHTAPELPSVRLDLYPGPRGVVRPADVPEGNHVPLDRRVRRTRYVSYLLPIDEDGVPADGHGVALDPEPDKEAVHVPLVRRASDHPLALVASLREADRGLHPRH